MFLLIRAGFTRGLLGDEKSLPRFMLATLMEDPFIKDSKVLRPGTD
jgi:hypothetical protein